jgi:hypothetical protein
MREQLVDEARTRITSLLERYAAPDTLGLGGAFEHLLELRGRRVWPRDEESPIDGGNRFQSGHRMTSRAV